MNTKVAFLLLLQVTGLPGAAIATVVEAPNPGISGGRVRIEMKLEYCGDRLLKLHLKNLANVPITFVTDIGALSEFQFLGFPQAGVMQFHAGETRLKLGGEGPAGWWYPNLLNSTIRTPRFVARGLKVDTYADEDLKPYRLEAGAEQIIIIDCARIFGLVDLFLKGEAPSLRADTCSAGMNIKVAGFEGVKSYLIASDWFKYERESVAEGPPGSPSPMSTPVRNPEIAALLDQLDAAPDWASMPPGKIAEQGPVLMTAIERCGTLSAADLRELIEQLLVRHDGTKPGDHEDKAWGKIFVLNRSYFAVPCAVPLKDARLFGGWLGVPDDKESIDVLWPLRFGADDTLELSSVTFGYIGPSYKALDEFDFFSSNYGRRVRKKH